MSTCSKSGSSSSHNTTNDYNNVIGNVVDDVNNTTATSPIVPITTSTMPTITTSKLPNKNNDNKKQPPLPSDWDRCHVWNPRKQRYCRQFPFAKGEHYCGNHRHLLVEEEQEEVQSPQQRNSNNNNKRKRIPCPLDESHWIFQDQLDKHVKKCPSLKKQKRQQEEPYYRENINGGGFGSLDTLGCRICQETTTNTTKQQQGRYAVGSAEWAQSVARRVLQVHSAIFDSERSSKASASAEAANITLLTDTAIGNALPMCDLSQPELTAGIADAFSSHHIKSGGIRHVTQIASLIGQLRAMKVLPPLPSPSIVEKQQQQGDTDATTAGTTTPTEKASSSSAQHQHQQNQGPLLFIEMGAGRGMFGLAAASVANAYYHGHPHCNSDKKNSSNVHLVMVERTGSRSKADTAFRNVPKEKDTADDVDTSYMKVDGVRWSRCSADLAHVNLQVLLEQTTPELQNATIVVIAKHLCGAGTDLALKSIASIQDRVHACIFATCCHGICDWRHYVGRDYLRQVMEDDDDDDDVGNNNNNNNEDGDNRNVPPPFEFGQAEFDLLRKWCAAVAHGLENMKTNKNKNNPNNTHNEGELDHGCDEVDEKNDDDGFDNDIKTDLNDSKTVALAAIAVPPTSISTVVKSLNLECGMQGLARACQRLIDYGRREYLRKHIFFDSASSGNDPSSSLPSTVHLIHYIPTRVSPQNAALVCCKG